MKDVLLRLAVVFHIDQQVAVSTLSACVAVDAAFRRSRKLRLP